MFSHCTSRAVLRRRYASVRETGSGSARYALRSLSNASNAALSASESGEISFDEWDDLNKGVQDVSRSAIDIKNKIVDTTFDNIPRSPTEMRAWLDAGRVPVYYLNRDWGLTAEERCSSKDTAISVVSGGVSADTIGATAIKVSVSSDGTLRAAHIVRSSGSDEADRVALSRVYGFKYHAATQRCVSVDSAKVIYVASDSAASESTSRASASSCAVPNKEAAIKGVAADADYPAIAKEQGAVGSVEVEVTLDETGAVQGVSVYKSSGSEALDNSALQAAKATSYAPATVDCVPQPGRYLFRHDFTGT